MITTHSINVNVSVKGEGRSIILLHGWGQNQYMMKFLQDHFCDRFQVVNLDLPGFGESEEPPCAWSIEDYAICIHDILTQLNITNPIIIAHSFGARIALRYALKYPVYQLILTGAAGLKNKRNLTYYFKIYTYKCLKKLHLQPAMGSEDYQAASPTMRGILVRAVEDDIRDKLKHISVETLLVWGEKDTQTPLWMGELMEREMKHATLITLPKEDHFAYFHQSLQFARICDAFLAG